MSDFRLLETFSAVAALGSFRAAAERLNTTQPAVSQRIRQLEEDLGARVFDRTSRVVRLTAKGQELAGYADRILRLGADMRAALAEGTEKGAARRPALAGVVRLGAAETIVHTWLPGFVGLLSREHPRLTLEIEVDTSPSLRQRLLSQSIDLALMLGPLSDPGVEHVPLPAENLAVLINPALLKGATLLSVQDLAARPIVTFARRTQPHQALRALLARPEWPAPVIHACAALTPALRLAAEGVAVAVLPPAVAARELEAGELVVVETDLDLPRLEFHACWLHRSVPGAAEAVGRLAAAHAVSWQKNLPGKR
jgi:DNA-binding transcriptional LysR family regulator